MLLPRVGSAVAGGGRAFAPFAFAKRCPSAYLTCPKRPHALASAPHAICPRVSSVLQARLYSPQHDLHDHGSRTPDTIRPAAIAPKTTLAKTLHEDIYTIPNLLTLSRLAAAPFVGYFILQDNHAWALGLLAYSGVTDLLDGWIARRWNLTTVVGTIIDPLADKTLMAILTVSLAVQGSLPVWLAGIILGRDVGLGIAAIYYRWISLPPPKTFSRYWDFSLPSAEVHPTTISKYNTFLQLALIGLTTAAPVIGHDVSTPLTVMQYIVATTTVWSGASYIYTKDAVKILKAPKT